MSMTQPLDELDPVTSLKLKYMVGTYMKADDAKPDFEYIDTLDRALDACKARCADADDRVEQILLLPVMINTKGNVQAFSPFTREFLNNDGKVASQFLDVSTDPHPGKTVKEWFGFLPDEFFDDE